MTGRLSQWPHPPGWPRRAEDELDPGSLDLGERSPCAAVERPIGSQQRSIKVAGHQTRVHVHIVSEVQAVGGEQPGQEPSRLI